MHNHPLTFSLVFSLNDKQGTTQVKSTREERHQREKRNIDSCFVLFSIETAKKNMTVNRVEHKVRGSEGEANKALVKKKKMWETTFESQILSTPLFQEEEDD